MKLPNLRLMLLVLNLLVKLGIGFAIAIACPHDFVKIFAISLVCLWDCHLLIRRVGIGLPLLVLISSLMVASAATSYTEFYCNASTGSNTNSGSSTGSATYSSVNGNWDGTSVFIPTDGTNPAASGVTTNTFASVYNDGAAVAVYIARITAVTNASNGGIVLDTTAKAGTPPTINATGRSITVGGAWLGPNAAVQFPFNFATAALTDYAGHIPRVNFKTGNYTLNNSGGAINHTLAGPLVFQGYNSSPGDEGAKATIQDTSTAASYVLVTLASTGIIFEDFILTSSFSSGVSHGLYCNTAESQVRHVIVHDVRGNGIYSNNSSSIIECETYNCDKSGTANTAGINILSGAFALRCISHHNLTSGAGGFVVGSGSVALNCIGSTNAADGFIINSTSLAMLNHCVAYANGGDGFDLTAASAMTAYLENCCAVKNTGYGINSSGSLTLRNGFILNTGIGHGIQANVGGDIAAVEGMAIIGTVDFADDVVPWVDPYNGDFRTTLAAAQGSGRGGFTETSPYGNTVSYPDIGAAQHQETGSTQHSFIFAQ